MRGSAYHSGDGEFLAHDHRVEVACGGEFSSGDEFYALGHLFAYLIEIEREVPDDPQR